MHKDKQSEEDDLIEKAVKTTKQKFYDEGLFDNYDNADELLKDFFLKEYNDRRRPDSEELNDYDDNVIH